MANPNLERGKRWERAIRDALREDGLEAVRPVQEKPQDVGDIHVRLSPSGLVVIQAKDWAKHDWPLFVDSAGAQAYYCGADYGFAVVKRRRANPHKAFFATDLATGMRLIHELERGREAVLRLQVLAETGA